MTAQDSLQSLLDYECLLFHCDWLGSDLRIGHFFSFRCPLVNTPQLNTQLSYEWIIELSDECRMTAHWRIWVWLLRYDRRSVGQSILE
jgi:hypothetical protein